LIKILNIQLSHPTPDNVALTPALNQSSAIHLFNKSITMANTLKRPQAKNIDEYIADFPEDIQKQMQELRATIQKAAPQAEETINYAIPTFTLNGNLVHFAGFKNHIGFYPAPSGIEAFKKDLSVYEGAKGSVQFPLGKALPLALVSRIVKFRVKENLEKAAAKNAKKAKSK
jgi:uncharacterized protein YdhG (YjbR/CyaY superfamily)